jgi:hypothetical protein
MDRPIVGEGYQHDSEAHAYMKGVADTVPGQAAASIAIPSVCTYVVVTDIC